MGRKSTLTDKRARRYIRILDDEKWEFIDRLASLDKYKKSFNLLINDALDKGLPELIKTEFDAPEIEPAETLQPYPVTDAVTEQYFVEVIMLLKEIIINDTINKSLLCSLFNVKELELAGKAVSDKLFSSGGLRDTPEYLTDYEIRALKEIREVKR